MSSCIICNRKISYKRINSICQYCTRTNNRLGKIISKNKELVKELSEVEDE